MTIKFICSCGKHLKARDEMAARRTLCPRCGNPVGVPSPNAGQLAGSAPLSPLERLRLARDRKPLPVEAPSPQPDSPPPTTPQADNEPFAFPPSSQEQRRTDRPKRKRQNRWHRYLLDPRHPWRVCLHLALVLTVLSAGLALILPHLLAELPDDPWAQAAIHLTWLLLLVTIFGLPYRFLERVLAAAAGEKADPFPRTGYPLFSGLRFLACFLAGPVVFAGIGWLYWNECEELALVDWLILAELGIVGVAYLLFAMLSLADRGRLRDLNPLTVIDLAHRLGWRTLVLVLAAAVVLLAHGLVLFLGIVEVSDTPFVGVGMIAGAWLSGLFWSTFFCRLLGLRHRKE